MSLKPQQNTNTTDWNRMISRSIDNKRAWSGPALHVKKLIV